MVVTVCGYNLIYHHHLVCHLIQGLWFFFFQNPKKEVRLRVGRWGKVLQRNKISELLKTYFNDCSFLKASLLHCRHAKSQERLIEAMFNISLTGRNTLNLHSLTTVMMIILSEKCIYTTGSLLFNLGKWSLADWAQNIWKMCFLLYNSEDSYFLSV